MAGDPQFARCLRGRVRGAQNLLMEETRGAQLLEFAFLVPLLVVLVVGVLDFGAAYALKDKVTNAAREGARISVSLPNDMTISPPGCGNAPCSVQGPAIAVVNYLTQAGLNVCGMNPSTTAPTATSPFIWTYSASCGTSGSWTLKFERAVTVTVGSTLLPATRVTITYPFQWAFGNVVKLMAPSSTYGATIPVSTSVTMANQD